jgi:TolB-like protein/DNA-binding winged helix-turn-helix (wHTH) protein/tetratricopeptide (TPR) repeat protein
VSASVNEVPPSRTLVRFGVFELDADSRELRKQGLKVRLQDQPFQVLQILLEHPGTVVTREELQRLIWPSDTFVDFDRGVYNAVKKLREALGDSAESPRFIETLSRRGYRFIAPVSPNGNTASSVEASSIVAERAPARTSRRTLQLSLAAGFGIVMVLAAGISVGKIWPRLTVGATPQIRSIAVLPLQNLSADPAQEYFSDGMTDALITDLAQIGSLKVISRTSSLQYKQTKKSLPEIARELGVDGIVEGTVQRSGDRVRITAQLIYGPSDKHVWANSFEGDMGDVFTLERDVTQEIARQIQAKLGNVTPEQPRPTNPKAFEAYLQGNYHLQKYSRGSGDEENKKAVDYFQQAIDADPNYALAYVGIANAYSNRFYASSQDTAIMLQAAERAVALAPNSSDAWAILAFSKSQVRDWSGAEADFQKAVALNPNNASAHVGFCQFLGVHERLDEGRKECQMAQELDPSNDHLSWILFLQGEDDHSIAIARMMLENHPDDGFSHHLLFQEYAKKGMQQESIQELEQAMTLYGFPQLATNLRRAFAVSGYSGAMREYARELEHLDATKELSMPVNLAEVYATIGDQNRAFYWLEQAYIRRDVVTPGADVDFIKSDPILVSLRSDPRFADLLHRLGLQQ